MNQASLIHGGWRNKDIEGSSLSRNWYVLFPLLGLKLQWFITHLSFLLKTWV